MTKDQDGREWERVSGSELRAGDTVEVWFNGGQDRITRLTPYRGPLTCFEPAGAQLASFASGTGMTIENGNIYSRVSFAKAEGAQ